MEKLDAKKGVIHNLRKKKDREGGVFQIIVNKLSAKREGGVKSYKTFCLRRT